MRTGVGLFEMQYLYVVWFVESIVAPIILLKWFRKEFEEFGVEKLLVYVGALASIVSIFLLLRPELNNFVRNSLISYSGADIERYELVRGFGIAENLLGSYAMIQGIILAICLMLLSRNSWFALPVIPLIISIAFNARTGLFSIPVALILLFVTGRITFKVLASVTLFVVFLILVFTTQNTFLENNAETINWLVAGFEVISDNFSGDFSSGAAGTLIQDEKFVPTNILEFFFGMAELGPDATRADNGYYYVLWYGGVVFLLLLLIYIGFMFYRLYRIDSNKYMPLMLFMLLLIFHVKWNYLFAPSGIFRLIGLYYVYQCMKANGYWNVAMMYSKKLKP